MDCETGGLPPVRHMVVCGLDRPAECPGADRDGSIPTDRLRGAGARRAPAGIARGQELVEFAILLPLLLLIAFGVLDLGRAFHASITITNAAREGARYAMLNPSDNAGIVAATQAEAQGSGLDLSASTIIVTCPSGCGSGLAVRVTVTYEFTLIMGLVFPDPNLQLVGAAEMMVP